jgi:nitrogen fixation protein FixH
MQRPNRWPLLIIALAIGFFALSAWSFHRAARGTSAITDADYYSHGLRYNQTLLEQNAAATLGWNTVVTLDGRRLRVVLTDRARQPVSTAHGSLTLHDGSHSEVFQLQLAEASRGVYLATLPQHLRGELTGRIDFEQVGTRLSKQLLLSLP